jgi:hypothetical protein
MGAARLALPQLIIYLAAIQDARKRIGKINYSVFGLLTDSEDFEFVYPDPSRTLFVSRLYQWMYEKVEIIQWIDKILEESIKASPHTTPIKIANTSLNAYQTYVKQEYQFGNVSDDFDLVEGESEEPCDIIRRDGYLVCRWAEDISNEEEDIEGS